MDTNNTNKFKLLIVGIGGFSRDLTGIIHSDDETAQVTYFDNMTPNLPETFLDRPILKTEAEVKHYFETETPNFALGFGGNGKLRHKATEYLKSLGGNHKGYTGMKTGVGLYLEKLEAGLIIISFSQISNGCYVGEGCTVSSNCVIGHDVRIGKFCEFAPGVMVGGWVEFGDYCQIGLGAVIMPKVKIGKNVVIGAGAVVTKDVADGQTVVGVPARPI